MTKPVDTNLFPVKDESDNPPSFLELPDGRRIAYRLNEGSLPGVVFMGGFKSDMNGAKATALEAFCRNRGQRFLRFDYTGHGQSSGDFKDGTIGGWKRDALDVIDHLAPDDTIIVGSSMGAWIMLLVALERKESIKALVGVASAPDFTERLIWQNLSLERRKEIERNGAIYIPSCYGEQPYPITRHLIQEGRNHLLLWNEIALPDIPVRLIHGAVDEDVPWHISVTLMEKLQTKDVILRLVKDGNHRMGAPSHVALLCRVVERLSTRFSGSI